MSYVVLDTETTGTDPSCDEVLSIAVLAADGTVLLNSLVRPLRVRRWPRAQQVHGITPAQVAAPGVPTLAELAPRLADAVRGCEVVIFNAVFDTAFLPGLLDEAAAVSCCMLAFSRHESIREWSDYHGDYRYQSLATAARHVGHRWQGNAHEALADCRATRDVWAWLTDPAERARLEEAAARRAAAAELAGHRRDVFGPIEQAEVERLRRAGWEWERRHYPTMGVRYRSEYQHCTAARDSADAFMLHLEGTKAEAWNRWGPQLLALPRYNRIGDEVPADLTKGEGWHLLPAAKRLKPAALLVYGPHDSPPHEWLDAHLLYKKRSLRRGLHYVPISHGYDPWPEGCYSRTTLQKQFKLKAKEIDAMQPACLRLVRRGDHYENQYLLYAYTPPAPCTPPTPTEATA